MFELGDWEVFSYVVAGRQIYVIDNFYNDPDIVYDYCTKPLPDPWKHNPFMGYNMDKYVDRRLIEDHDALVDIYDKLSYLCKQKPESPTKFVTNVSTFHDRSYNNYEEFYWWPHTDLGFNGVVYLNDEDPHPGTNLFSAEDKQPLYPEWLCPWVRKENHTLIHTTEARYNRCVLFDGQLHHGMAVEDDRYFGKYRVNQVYFFQHENVIQ